MARGSVVKWGNSYAGTSALTDNDIVQISIGYGHIFGLKENGSIVAVGPDHYNSITDKPSGTGFKQVEVITGFGAAAIDSSNRIVTWGYQNYKIINTPPVGTGYKKISCSSGIGLALKNDGSIVAWGEPSNTPELISNKPAGTGFIDIQIGSSAAIALKSDGTILAWGWATDPILTNKPTGNGFTKISLRSYVAIALKSDGSIVVWGRNNAGELSKPSGNNFIDVAAGGEDRSFYMECSMYAIRDNGVVEAWGRSAWGELNVPVGINIQAIVGGDGGAAAIIAPAKQDQPAPSAPIASNVTSNAITWTSSGNSKVVCNNQEKPSGSVWTGLNALTEYAAYAYFPEDDYYNRSPDSVVSKVITTAAPKQDQVAPSIPEAILVTGNSISLKSDPGAMIECNGQTKISGSTWSGLQPITAYTAKAYMPETETHKRSPYSGEVTVTTTKLSQEAPQRPRGTELTARSVILTSSPGSMIICDGQEKPSGSLFLWLNPDMVYRAYAYFPETANESRSPNSMLYTFTTLEEPVDEEVVVFGVLSNGTPAPSQYLQGMTITASNDCVEIKDGQILAVKPGYCTITFMIGDITTYMDVVVQ